MKYQSYPIIVSCPVCRFQNGDDREERYITIYYLMDHLRDYHYLDDPEIHNQLVEQYCNNMDDKNLISEIRKKHYKK